MKNMMLEGDAMPQRKGMQRAETAGKSPDHMMPGIVPQIVDTFRRRRSYLTTRGISRAKNVPLTIVHTALFRDLYEQLDDLRRLVGIRRAA